MKCLNSKSLKSILPNVNSALDGWIIRWLYLLILRTTIHNPNPILHDNYNLLYTNRSNVSVNGYNVYDKLINHFNSRIVRKYHKKIK